MPVDSLRIYILPRYIATTATAASVFVIALHAQSQALLALPHRHYYLLPPLQTTRRATYTLASRAILDTKPLKWRPLLPWWYVMFFRSSLLPADEKAGEDQGPAQAGHQPATHGAAKRHSHSKAAEKSDGTAA